MSKPIKNIDKIEHKNILQIIDLQSHLTGLIGLCKYKEAKYVSETIKNLIEFQSFLEDKE